MKKYLVEIKETLSRIVPIKADSKEKAEEKASSDYYREKYVLDWEDCEGVTFKATSKEAA